MNKTKEIYKDVNKQVDKILQNNKNNTPYPIYYPPIKETEKQPKSIDYYCSNCGRCITINESFCPYCGKKI